MVAVDSINVTIRIAPQIRSPVNELYASDREDMCLGAPSRNSTNPINSTEFGRFG